MSPPADNARVSASDSAGARLNEEQMSGRSLISFAQAQLDEARRALKDAAVDFSVSDEQVLELRAAARRAYEELTALDRKAAKKGLLGFLGL